MQLKSVIFGLIALASLASALPTPGVFTSPDVDSSAMAKRDEANTVNTEDYEPQVSYWSDAYPASEEELASTS